MTPKRADVVKQDARLVQSVARAAHVLRHLASSEQPVSLSEVAEVVSLSKPATLHLLRTLAADRFVERDERGAYRLSWGLYELGSAVLRSVDLIERARPVLDDLAAAAGEAALLGVISDDAVLYVGRAQPPGSFTMVANTGRRSPFHTNASGKVLLAHQPDDYVRAYLAAPLTPRTGATIREPQILWAQLESIRSHGYGTCWQEQELGLSSVACPVLDHSGDAVAALTLAGPSERVSPHRMNDLLAILRPHADRLSAAMGAPLPTERELAT
jgi:DNA-binding IclR family transcriptional regulator